MSDLTVIITAHSETVVSGPSMRSAIDACARAEADGYAVERIIGLDTSTAACRAYFMQPAFDDWKRIEVHERDAGRTRNATIAQAKGRFIALLDADDLFSENWLSKGAKCLDDAAARGERVIAHPEINWFFDAGGAVFATRDQSDPMFSSHYFYFRNYYDTLCMAPREAHLEFPYGLRDIANGISREDWQFSIETMAAGWRHVVVKDTIIFKRRRDASLVTESRDRRAIVRALEPMRIDKVAALGRAARPEAPASPAPSVPGEGAHAHAAPGIHSEPDIGTEPRNGPAPADRAAPSPAEDAALTTERDPAVRGT